MVGAVLNITDNSDGGLLAAVNFDFKTECNNISDIAYDKFKLKLGDSLP